MVTGFRRGVGRGRGGGGGGWRETTHVDLPADMLDRNPDACQQQQQRIQQQAFFFFSFSVCSKGKTNHFVKAGL